MRSLAASCALGCSGGHEASTLAERRFTSVVLRWFVRLGSTFKATRRSSASTALGLLVGARAAC